MKLSNLYRIKGYPIVTISIVAISFLMSCLVYFIPELFGYLCLQTNPNYAWQYFSGIFIHNIEPMWVMWVHMIMNFMGLIPLGIITEKVIGSKDTLLFFLLEWIATTISFQLLTWNNPGQASGISSIEYAFATVGFYCVFLVLRRGKPVYYKQPLFYYFLFELMGMISLLNPLSSMTSFVLHISGVLMGMICIVIKEKDIKIKVDGMIKDTALKV